jgi:cell division septation protein DedD
MLFNQAFTRKMNIICTNILKEDFTMSVYKIMVETTQNKTLAKKQLDTLRSNKITCHISTLKLDNQTFYSVQAGPFTEKKDALTHVDAIKNLGIRHAFITKDAI